MQPSSRRCSARSSCLPVLLLVLAAPAATGQATATEKSKILASGPQTTDWFGSSVALSGDSLLVGAQYAEEPGTSDTGTAYVFVRDGAVWSEQQVLVSNDPAVLDGFGSTVALSGDTALVSETGDDYLGFASSVGAAHVFVRNGSTWSWQQKLMGSDVEAQDVFGASMALAGDLAVIGALWVDQGMKDGVGAAYVFVRSGSTWTEQQKLTPSAANEGSRFGASISLAGDRLIIGANRDKQDRGSAFLFAWNGSSWVEQQKLNASDGAQNDYFGWSVAVSGDRALVGARSDDQGRGSVYAFAWNGSSWIEQQKLTASDGLPNDIFGNDVALSGDTALVAAPGDDQDTGSVYLFAWDGSSWVEQQKLIAADRAAGDGFGHSITLADSAAVIGTYQDDHGHVVDAGSAYEFGLCLPPATYCTAGTSASGCQAVLAASGVPSASALSGFVLSASNVEGAKDGLFFFGTNGQQANPWGNGTSYQCISPPVKRLGGLVGTGTVGACDGAFAQDLNATWCPTCPKAGLNPGGGAQVQAQLWYRDPLSTSNQTTSLSDAMGLCVVP